MNGEIFCDVFELYSFEGKWQRLSSSTFQHLCKITDLIQWGERHLLSCFLGRMEVLDFFLRLPQSRADFMKIF